MLKNLISLAVRYIPRPVLQRLSHSGLYGLSLFYRGNSVACPVCTHTYRKFLPYGRKARENALCPNCLSLERHRLIWLYLQQKTHFFSAPLEVLHMAPEACFIDRFAALQNLTYVTADIESPLAQVKADIHALPFPEKQFDVVFCNHVLEHVADDHKAMTELYRVLKPDGWGILQIPLFHPLPEKTYEDARITSPAEREKAFGQRDHVRLYGKDYVERLRKAGFEAKEDWFVRELPEAEARRYALPTDEPIFFVRRATG
jgi:SAM-dependent methyltransferase